MASSIPTPVESQTVVSRKEALQQGLSHYFTGKPCKQGHVAERSTVHKECMECSRLRCQKAYWRDPAKDNARRKATRRANPEKARAYTRVWHAQWKKKNPERVNAQNRAWRAKNPELATEMRLRWEAKHKQRMQDDPAYAAEWREKGKVKYSRRKVNQVKLAGRPRPDACEVCGRKVDKICYDHCHQSGEFRGWLCSGCNSALGHAKDSPEVLLRLAMYLMQHEKKTALKRRLRYADRNDA